MMDVVEHYKITAWSDSHSNRIELFRWRGKAVQGIERAMNEAELFAMDRDLSDFKAEPIDA